MTIIVPAASVAEFMSKVESGNVEAALAVTPFIVLDMYGGAGSKGKTLIKFTETTLKHMKKVERWVPIQILDLTVKSTKGLPDPQGSNAMMHYSRYWINDDLYNLEVLYDKSKNTVLHFKYTREAIGPLKKIKK
jgi:hypothetical protein